MVSKRIWIFQAPSLLHNLRDDMQTHQVSLYSVWSTSERKKLKDSEDSVTYPSFTW